MNDQNEIVIDQFRGLYAYGANENIPKGYGSDVSDIVFTDNTIKGRPGFSLDITLPDPILRVHNFQRSDAPVTPRYLVLCSTGNMYDTGFSLVTPIRFYAGATDFSMISLYNRAIISIHDRVSGVFPHRLNIWDPSIMIAARDAAGYPPITGPTAATGAAGNVAGGKHLISVAYETNTGFITKPGPSTQYTAPGNAQINLTNIPTGGAEIAKRHILVTPVLLSYDGNPSHYEHFFVATIEDNVTTILTINFIDSALVQSADYLFDQLSFIHCGVGLAIFQGCLLVYGQGGAGIGETVNRMIIRVSKSGQIENFSEVDGFVPVDPSDGGGVKNACEFRGLLYAMKSSRLYNIQANDGPPNTWNVVQIDTGIGCECFGLGIINDDEGGVTNEAMFIAGRSGIWLFDGSVPEFPLTRWISDFYVGQFDFLMFNRFQLLIDSTNKLIYFNFKRRGGEYQLLVGDYKKGLTPDAIRWSYWKEAGSSFGFDCIVQDINTQLIPVLKVAGGGTSVLVAYDTTAVIDYSNTGIAPKYEFGYLRFGDYGVDNFSQVGLKLEGTLPTSMRISLRNNSQFDVKTLTVTPNRQNHRLKFNFNAEQAAVIIEGDAPFVLPATKQWEVSKVILFGNRDLQDYPG
jgi:hypothetical protein